MNDWLESESVIIIVDPSTDMHQIGGGHGGDTIESVR